MRGASKTEILEFIGAPDENILHEAFGKLIGDEKSPMKIANRMLAKSDLVVREEAESLLRVSQYKGGVACRPVREHERNLWWAGLRGNR